MEGGNSYFLRKVSITSINLRTSAGSSVPQRMRSPSKKISQMRVGPGLTTNDEAEERENGEGRNEQKR